jgi:hypothetical protein
VRGLAAGLGVTLVSATSCLEARPATDPTGPSPLATPPPSAAAAASRVPRDDIGATATVRIRRGTQLCVDPRGLRVQFQPGELDSYGSTVGPSVTLPKELARGLVPADTPLGRALQ